MSLAPSTQLGPYKVLSLVGAGGMGEVYRAQDTRLGRIVAIKVLPAHLSGRPEVRQRFEREARAVSRLEHPNICALHDIGQQDGIDYLVMEFLEGETLAQLLKKGRLAVDQALRFGLQTADALDHAHRQGIIHRDLKPGNIMVTRSGVKVLDFGLAKIRPEPGVASPLTEITKYATATAPLTDQGAILGTFQYMAPEQLEGKEADVRTDIFAFGAVLYEMVTGQRAFQGKTQANLISSIMTTEPTPVSAAEPVAPVALSRLVRKCLAKNPEDRWQTARDLHSELQWVAESSAHSVAALSKPEIRAARPWWTRPRLPWIVTAAAVLVAVLLAFLYFGRSGDFPGSDGRSVRFVVLPPEKTSLAGSIAVSPDGTQLAFATTTPEGKTSLWVRSLDSLNARSLPGTEGALHPFWSPNGRFLAFFAEGKLKKIRVDEGPPQSLCDVFDARGGTWSPRGVIVFAPNVGDRLYQIAEGGGPLSPVTTLQPARGESSHQWPYLLPDGRHFLYLVWSEQAEARGIYAGSIDSKETHRLMGADGRVTYARGPGKQGYLLFLRGRALMGQPFDADSLKVSGEPVALGDQAWYDETTPGLAAFSTSENGVLAYRSGGVRSTQLAWFDRAGKPLDMVGAPGAYRDPWLSPDGRRLVISRIDPQTGTHDVWLVEIARGAASRFTFHPSEDTFPLWSPDGSRIVFATNRDGAPNLYQKSASGSGSEEPLLRSDVSKFPTDWTSDGRFLIFANWDPKTKWDLWVLPVTGDRKPFPVQQSEFDAFQATFSPDGHWIAYASNESNRYEVYVQPFSGAPGPPGSKQQISTSGGAQPRWRRDGKELFYLSLDRKLMAVDVKLGANFEAGVPKALFQIPVTGVVDARNHYFVSPDGQRFLVNALTQESASSPLTVVLNWPSTLKR